MNRRRLWMRVASAATVAAVFSLLVLGCKSSKSDTDANWPDKPGLKIATSFAPIHCFAVNVAGDDATVRNIMTTTGPHDFEPTVDHAKLVSKADILFINGIALDDGAADQMKKGSSNTKLKIVPLSDAIPRQKRLESQCTHEHKPGEDHKHGDDPHIWLSPDHAILMVNQIRDTLKAEDPAHAPGYDQRAAAYVAKLSALKEYGAEKLKGKKDNRLVTFHDSLAYFAQCYNLEIRGILTQKPGQEPDDKELRKLIRICTDENKPTRVIAVEPQYSNSTSGETLRKELVAKKVNNPVLVEIDTLETVRPDELTPDWYEKKIRANIDALAKALE
jgi:zinc transport system substrate-binding protein